MALLWRVSVPTLSVLPDDKVSFAPGATVMEFTVVLASTVSSPLETVTSVPEVVDKADIFVLLATVTVPEVMVKV